MCGFSLPPDNFWESSDVGKYMSLVMEIKGSSGVISSSG